MVRGRATPGRPSQNRAGADPGTKASAVFHVQPEVRPRKSVALVVSIPHASACAFPFCDGPRYFPGVVMQNVASGPPGATHAPPSCTRFRRSGGLRIHHHISGLVRYASSCFAGQSTTHQMCAPLFNELVKPLLSSSGGSGTLNSVAQSLPSVSTYHAAADVMALGLAPRWLSGLTPAPTRNSQSCF